MVRASRLLMVRSSQQTKCPGNTIFSESDILRTFFLQNLGWQFPADANSPAH